MCLVYGGNGLVTNVNGDGVLRMFTVKYDEFGSSRSITAESEICFSCLIVVPSPFALRKLVRERHLPDTLNFEHHTSATGNNERLTWFP